jgi:hypothetical protein
MQDATSICAYMTAAPRCAASSGPPFWPLKAALPLAIQAFAPLLTLAPPPTTRCQNRRCTRCPKPSSASPPLLLFLCGQPRLLRRPNFLPSSARPRQPCPRPLCSRVGVSTLTPRPSPLPPIA